MHEAIIIKADSPFMTAPQLSVDAMSESASTDSVSDSSKNVNTKFSDRDSEYTEQEYRDYGWARENGILNEGQNEDYRSKFADAVNGYVKFNKTKRGEFIIPVSDIYDSRMEGIDNILVFAMGNIDNPIITSIIEIYEFDEKRITDTSSWYSGRLNGDDLFVIYSTEYPSNPTILYEVKGKNAKLEQNILTRALEVIGNERSAVEKQRIVNELLSGNWVPKTHNLAHNNDRLGNRGSNIGNASVLQGQSSQFIGSGAFRNVIENLFEIQSRKTGGLELFSDRETESVYDILSIPLMCMNLQLKKYKNFKRIYPTHRNARKMGKCSQGIC